MLKIIGSMTLKNLQDSFLQIYGIHLWLDYNLSFNVVTLMDFDVCHSATYYETCGSTKIGELKKQMNSLFGLELEIQKSDTEFFTAVDDLMLDEVKIKYEKYAKAQEKKALKEESERIARIQQAEAQWIAEFNSLDFDSRRRVELSKVPEEYRTYKLCQIAVEKYGMNLSFVPEVHKTESLCIKALEKGGRFDSLPDKYRTLDMAKISVSHNTFGAFYIPKELFTEELCGLAVEHGNPLSLIPVDLRTAEVCKIAVKRNGENLEQVPQEVINIELCEIAVNRHGDALKDVPKRWRTPRLCRLAVENCAKAIRHVPYEFITVKLCKIALENASRHDFDEVMRFVPKGIETPELHALRK